MNELPKELRIEIFSYLSFRNLRRLTLTCKSFNELISNSSTLMDKFRLVYTSKNTLNVDLMIKRKYQRIKIQFVHEYLFKLLEYHGKHICEIVIDYSNLKSRDLIKILNACPNFKQLRFIDRYFNDDWIEPLSKLSFESIAIARYNEQDEMTPEKSKKSLDIQLKLVSERFINFIRNQKQLKTLRFWNYNLSNQFFAHDSLVNVNFQLDTLLIMLESSKISNVDNFKKFLKNQKSLRKFIDFDNSQSYYNNFIYADVLNDLKNVKELLVIRPFFNTIPMLHIEILSIYIGGKKINRDLKFLFPNLKNLSIESLHAVKFVKKVTETATKKCVEITIPDSVKVLTIKYRDDCLFDDDVDIKIEKLTISCFHNIDWLIDCFKNDRNKLKSLTIEVNKIEKCQQDYLDSLTQGESKKIEELNIFILKEFDETDDYVSDHEIEYESDDFY